MQGRLGLAARRHGAKSMKYGLIEKGAAAGHAVVGRYDMQIGGGGETCGLALPLSVK